MNQPIDPRLRDALRDFASDAPTGADDLWSKTENRIAVHRRRRAIGSGVVSTIAVVVMVGGVVAVTNDDSGAPIASTATSTAPSSTAVEPADTGVSTGERVAAFDDGRIATIGDEWQPVETIARAGREQFVRQLAVAPDGASVYYLVDADPGPYGSDCATLIAFNVETRRPRVVGATRSFALSPDGSQLALGMHADDAGNCVSRDIDGGALVRVIDAESSVTAWDWSDTAYAYVEAMAWDPNGARVAAEVCDARCRVAVVALDGVAGPYEPAAPADQVVSLAWGPEGLRTLEACCRAVAADDERALLLRSVDPAAGASEDLYDLGIETDPTDVELVALASGWYVLQRSPSVGGVEAELLRVDPGADVPVERVAGDITAVSERFG